MLAGLPAEQRAPLQTAMEAALRKVRLEQAGEPVPDELAATVARADAERFAGLRTMLASTRSRRSTSGQQPRRSRWWSSSTPRVAAAEGWG